MAVEAKICGLTRPEDAVHAVRSGAAYLGVIFAGGPREVSPRQAAEVVRAAESVPVLGVFAGRGVDEILRLRDASGLAGAQLHSGYDAAEAGRLRDEGLMVWRVARIAAEPVEAELRGLADTADVVLLEPSVERALGGTGTALPVDLAARARRMIGVLSRVALAGGLTPDTVAETVALVQPDIVDVSSGVEISPGIKDPQRVTRFLEAVVGHFPAT